VNSNSVVVNNKLPHRPAGRVQIAVEIRGFPPIATLVSVALSVRPSVRHTRALR